MIDARQFAERVIIPVLESLDMNSPSAVTLLLCTAAVETRLGSHLVQLGGGPALGVYQCEKRTHDDVVRYLGYNPRMMSRVMYWTPKLNHSMLVGNLYYATAIARVHYYRISKSLPESDDITGLGEYWKQYYNTPLGAGTVEKFVKTAATVLGIK